MRSVPRGSSGFNHQNSQLLSSKLKTPMKAVLHLTAQQFILSPRLCSDPGLTFVPQKYDASSDIAKTYLSYIMDNVLARPLGGDIHMRVTIDDLRARYPLLKYASPNWLEYFKDSFQRSFMPSTKLSSKSTALQEIVQQFLSAKANLMVWIEALYTRGDTSFIQPADSAARALAAYLEFKESVELESRMRRLSKDLTDLGVALQEIEKEWGNTLPLRLHEIWNDLTFSHLVDSFCKHLPHLLRPSPLNLNQNVILVDSLCS